MIEDFSSYREVSLDQIVEVVPQEWVSINKACACCGKELDPNKLVECRPFKTVIDGTTPMTVIDVRKICPTCAKLADEINTIWGQPIE